MDACAILSIPAFILLCNAPDPASICQPPICLQSGPRAVPNKHNLCFSLRTLCATWQVMKYIFSTQPQLRSACSQLLRVQPGEVSPDQLLELIIEQVGPKTTGTIVDNRSGTSSSGGRVGGTGWAESERQTCLHMKLSNGVWHRVWGAVAPRKQPTLP